MSASPPVHRFRLLAPRVLTNEIRFEWEITPATGLYQRDGFRITFPWQLDPGRVPYSLWLRLAMLCLHPHWALLRPCVVELPFYIGPDEREFWQRLACTAAIQLEAYGGEPRSGAAVTIHDDGPTLAPVRVQTANGRVAAAFSGGKDSLTQSGLLAELTDRPLLVTTTSPVPWAHDHGGAARRRVLTEITRRLQVELVEVQSDFRACWDNGFAHAQGCAMTLNELTDVLLYQAATLAAAAAAGISRAFQASEADLQYNQGAGGAVIQHGHFASSAVTHRALDRLLQRFGLRLGSLTYPLHTDQVQSLLLRRYGQLAELQFSCWSADDGAQACGSCGQCLEIAVMLLGEGVSPRRAGIDPVHVLVAWAEPRPPSGPRSSRFSSAREKTARIVQSTSPERVAEILADEPEREAAVAAYEQLRGRMLQTPVPPHPGYIPGLLECIDADLRDPLKRIFDDQCFTAGEDPELAAIASRSVSLSRWIADPLTR